MSGGADAGAPRDQEDPAADERLLAAFLDGDQRAFDELVSRYQRRVYGICLRYFGNPSDAEDAAQDAFVAVYRRAASFSGTAAFSTWMYRVATNACHDLARKRARRPKSAGVDVERLADSVTAAETADASVTAELDDDLRAALEALDPDTRDAVILHDVRGVPYADIAARSGVAVGTVKSRIHRGHARMAAALAESRAAPVGEAGREPHPRGGRRTGTS